MQRPHGEGKARLGSVAMARVQMERGRSQGSAQKGGVRDEGNGLR